VRHGKRLVDCKAKVHAEAEIDWRIKQQAFAKSTWQESRLISELNRNQINQKCASNMTLISKKSKR